MPCQEQLKSKGKMGFFEKEISGSIDQEDVGSFHNDMDDNDIESLEEHSISTIRVVFISSSRSSIQKTPTCIPLSTSNSSSVNKSSTNSSPDTSEVSPYLFFIYQALQE